MGFHALEEAAQGSGTVTICGSAQKRFDVALGEMMAFSSAGQMVGLTHLRGFFQPE